jgi:hypothetical protein
MQTSLERIGTAAATAALHDAFGDGLSAEYVPGKTQFRDALYDRFGLSRLEAEELCDSLEQAGLISFVSNEREGIEGWRIGGLEESSQPLDATYVSDLAG